MTIGLDTSVVVRLLTGEPAPQADAARRELEAAQPGSVLMSDLVVGESYFALRHHYGVPHARALAALRALADDPRVHCPGVAGRVLPLAPEREGGAGVMDRLIHADYAATDATLVTFDRDAARLPGCRALD